MARISKAQQISEAMATRVWEGLRLIVDPKSQLADGDKPGSRWTGNLCNSVTARKLVELGCVRILKTQKVGLGAKLMVKPTVLGIKVASFSD